MLLYTQVEMNKYLIMGLNGAENRKGDVIMPIRKDNWSEQDICCTKTYSRRNLQPTAFEDVRKALGRTASACGFHWNLELYRLLFSFNRSESNNRLPICSYKFFVFI